MSYIIKGYINNYGFCIKKKYIKPEIFNILKKYFSVKPELNYENDKILEKDKYFDVYYQDEIYIVLPKFSINITINILKYNEKKNLILNMIEYNKIIFEVKKFKYSKSSVNFDFNGKLRNYQQEIIDEIIKKFGLDISNPSNHNISQTFPKGGLIKLSCGGGKCLGYNTPVIMYDGTIKSVQDILVNDQLMGDDSTPRNVLNLARGQEQMYQINQEHGEPYIVNYSHILSLYNPNSKQIIDISLEEYLKLNDKQMIGDLYGFKTTIEFQEKYILYESYYFANLIFNESENNINSNNYQILNNYKYNSIKQRKLFMAGLFDNVSSKYQNNNFILNIKNNIFKNDIIFIARSIGLFVNINNYDLIFYGDNLNSLPYKKKYVGLNNELEFSNIIYYKINVVSLNVDNYYGFEIDGNKRFLLGDFTVTHNTMLAIYLSWLLGLKTLVVTHKEFLMDQWEKRINQFTNAKVGRIRQNKIDVENKDIVIGMLRSLSTKNYDKDILHQFGLVIYDEAHHTGSRVDSQALLNTSAEYTIGLSATPERTDGMTKILNWHIGGILYEMEKKYNYRVLVKKIYFRSNDVLFKEKKNIFSR